MRSFVLTLLLALLTCEVATAQPAVPASQATAVRSARIKIWTGIAMMSAGAVVLPVTGANSSRDPDSGVVLSSLGLIGVGSGLVYWGFRQQQKAAQPSTAFGVTLGRTSRFVVRRSW
jgi:hypothetical protein